MKRNLTVVGFLVVCLAGGTGWGQTAAAAATNVSPAAPALSAKAIAAMETKLADWQQVGRYREVDAELGPVARGEQGVVFYGDPITDGWGRGRERGEFFPGK